MQEIWRDIKGYEELYQVSNTGKIKSLDREVWGGKVYYLKEGQILKPTNNSGYMYVGLYKNKKCKLHAVHRLVAQTFIPNPENKPEVNHINGIKDDNRLENLEWNTISENRTHAVQTGLRKSAKNNKKMSIPVSQYDADGNLINIYPSMREASRQTGVDATAIGHGIRKGWKYGGFKWAYYEELVKR